MGSSRTIALASLLALTTGCVFGAGGDAEDASPPTRDSGVEDIETADTGVISADPYRPATGTRVADYEVVLSPTVPTLIVAAGDRVEFVGSRTLTANGRIGELAARWTGQTTLVSVTTDDADAPLMLGDEDGLAAIITESTFAGLEITGGGLAFGDGTRSRPQHVQVEYSGSDPVGIVSFHGGSVSVEDRLFFPAPPTNVFEAPNVQRTWADDGPLVLVEGREVDVQGSSGRAYAVWDAVQPDTPRGEGENAAAPDGIAGADIPEYGCLARVGANVWATAMFPSQRHGTVDEQNLRVQKLELGYLLGDATAVAGSVFVDTPAASALDCAGAEGQVFVIWSDGTRVELFRVDGEGGGDVSLRTLLAAHEAGTVRSVKIAASRQTVGVAWHVVDGSGADEVHFAHLIDP